MTDRALERTELIQSAAVIVSIVEDMDKGKALVSTRTNDILMEVLDERFNQDEKWGPQHHDALTWAMILAEEIGEYVEELSPELVSEAAEDVLDVLVRLVGAGRDAKQWLEESNLG